MVTLPHRRRPPRLPHLPHDILLRVVECVDGGTPPGKRTLLALTRVSKSCCIAAERVLYRDVQFDGLQLALLLNGLLGRSSSPDANERACRRIKHIERLRLFDPPPPLSPRLPIELLWEAAATLPKGKPLFPRVQVLALHSPGSHHNRYAIHEGRPSKNDMPEGILIFDTVDVCAVKPPTNELLEYLPIRSLPSWTFHETNCDTIFDSLPLEWCAWKQLNIFAYIHGGYDMRRVGAFEGVARSYNFNSIRVLSRGARWEPPEDSSEWWEWQRLGIPKEDRLVQLDFYDPWDPRCPTCAVCGASTLHGRQAD